jgi:hypothetical protein
MILKGASHRQHFSELPPKIASWNMLKISKFILQIQANNAKYSRKDQKPTGLLS